MILLRKAAAIGALLALGILMVTLESGPYGVNPGPQPPRGFSSSHSA